MWKYLRCGRWTPAANLPTMYLQSPSAKASAVNRRMAIANGKSLMENNSVWGIHWQAITHCCEVVAMRFVAMS